MITVSWEKFEKDIQTLAEIIMGSGCFFTKIVAVTRGGLIPAYYLADILDIKWIDTLGIESYEDKKQGGLQLIKGAFIQESEAEVLIVDDLVDTGKTLEYSKLLFPLAKTAVLYQKGDAKHSADFFTVHTANEWITLPWPDSK